MPAHRAFVAAGAAVLSSLLLVAAIVAPVAARTEVFTIAIDLDEGGGGERFESDNSLLCPEGDAFTSFEHGNGNFVVAASFHLTKLIVCEDGSGTFRIRVDAGTNFVVGDGTTGGWSVVPGSGTGDYVGLKGGGSVVGINSDEGPIDLVDHYFGRVGF